MTDEGVLSPEVSRKNFNWVDIENAYRAGVLSIRTISKVYGLSEGMIRKKAKSAGWRRDLRARVDEQVRTHLSSAAVRTPYARAREERQEREREIVAVAAASIVQVVEEHRQLILSARGIVNMLVGHLWKAANEREELEQEIEQVTADDRDGKRRAFLARAVGLPQHAATLKDLSLALRNLVSLERQAFDISDKTDAERPPAAPADKVVDDAYFVKLCRAFDKCLGVPGDPAVDADRE